MATVLRGSDNFDTDGLDNTKYRVATAWAHVAGSGTPGVIDSYNVSSVTDNGVGNYICNFTSIMDNSSYNATCSFNDAADAVIRTVGFFNEGKTVSSLNTLAKADGVLSDGAFSITIFGGKN